MLVDRRRGPGKIAIITVIIRFLVFSNNDWRPLGEGYAYDFCYEEEFIISRHKKVHHEFEDYMTSPQTKIASISCQQRKVHGRLNASWKISSLAVNGQSFLVIDGYLLNPASYSRLYSRFNAHNEGCRWMWADGDVSFHVPKDGYLTISSQPQLHPCPVG